MFRKWPVNIDQKPSAIKIIPSMSEPILAVETRRQRICDVLAFNKLSAALLTFIVCAMAGIITLEWDLFYDYHSRVGADWLLISIFAIMLFFLTMGASFRKDAIIMFVALIGGLIIESWGTQTELWRYYTEFPPYENPSRPPWWIIPAWPISSLAINRIYLFLDAVILKPYLRPFQVGYWVFCVGFAFIFYQFTHYTWHLSWTKIFTVATIIIVAFPKNDHRKHFLILIAGTSLGYFLELWGTTRACWIYYTGETPPLMVVFAHGIASVGFTRGATLIQFLLTKMINARAK